jgi:hypothetical protein
VHSHPCRSSRRDLPSHSKQSLIVIPASCASGSAGAKSYDRERDLPGLVRLDPAGRGNETVADMEAIVRRLERALRAERNRARSGHWTYDLNRHIALRQAHLAESARLAARLKPHGQRDEPAT